ncbi:unnamed protein product [Periconia digitata]|uniref:Uncharacterized protein n=1 Tax=Periconia digitata TaxID=1303443 RepID=A0A9W4UHL4_9PLEO|nr:unnamed protein product [Periconia digitata]
MDEEGVTTRLARDRLAMLTELYTNPSRALGIIPTTAKQQHRNRSYARAKRTRSSGADLNEFPFPLQPSPGLLSTRGYRVAQTPTTATRKHSHHNHLPMPVVIAQDQKNPPLDGCYRDSTATAALLQNSISPPDLDPWVLPDFEDWELEAESPSSPSPRREPWRGAGAAEKSAEWAPLVERAVRSNQERLRLRLEGDGWAFVGRGRYAEDVVEEGRIEEKVDEEFDVVILPRVAGVA